MITPTTKSTISNSGMESSYAGSILKSIHANSKSKSSESTLVDYRVEFLVKYSIL